MHSPSSRLQIIRPVLADYHIATSASRGQPNAWKFFIKRSFDIISAATVLLLLSWLFAVIAIAIRLEGGPVFYVHKRQGKGGRQFNCYKFRSMYLDADERLRAILDTNPRLARQWKLYQKLAPHEDTRITRVGMFLRKTNLDELPQLLNVLKGEMSIVGPRPILPEQRPYSGIYYLYLIKMRPGITGLWQVSGRNKLTYGERMEVESNYVRNWGLRQDMIILVKTIPVLLKANPVDDKRA